MEIIPDPRVRAITARWTCGPGSRRPRTSTPREARMEFDQQADRLPFHVPDEAEQAHPDAPAASHDARIRHLQRVPLFNGFNEDELRRVAELSRIVEAPAGTAVTQIGEPGDHSSSSSTARWRCARRSAQERATSRRLLWRDESARWGVAIGDDHRHDRCPAAHRGSLLLEETPDLVRRILTILSRRVRRLEQTVHAILRGPNPT